MFGVQLYKNNAHPLLSRILSILNLDWLQHACGVHGVYEWKTIPYNLYLFLNEQVRTQNDDIDVTVNLKSYRL